MQPEMLIRAAADMASIPQNKVADFRPQGRGMGAGISIRIKEQ